MSILQKIVGSKRTSVEKAKELYPTKLLEQSIYFPTPCVSLKKYLQRRDKVGIIAEIKRRSPSKGDINPYIDVEDLSIGYMQAGASALSVLTDKEFFGGSNNDLQISRKFNFCPILRKDFIIDEYQIVEAKSIGADVVLLIAAALSQAQIKELSQCAKNLGMEVLLEIHEHEELDYLIPQVDIVGVNNRNLSDFSVSLQKSFDIGSQIPPTFLKISESGISKPQSICKLKQAGFDGFLIGENFMKHSYPQQACAQFISMVHKEMAKCDAD
ncbi:indole-3-glycerol phosphate synthase TrpC [Candidatus Uabimicrobium sp. HlEnr_7]|uniref:indole-3-glycerol phosphate synthase TrpC n=1 Tax=Candidatus Uabimicrobium helgolandensis TaxID=3095367 RepID=UPI0035588BE5